MSGNKSAHSLNLKRFYDIIKVERKVERKNKTMAKKIVRGITDVKTINNQDFDTNNVNDLLSDGQYNYIHRKKGKNEEYHNLTDNIKTISSDNTELLSVTNNNKTTNTATLHPKHDSQKEQVLESTRNTISIHHGTNGTAEKTTVDTNPKKVLEHENLISDSEYITLNHQQGENVTHIKTAALKEKLDNLQQTKQDTLIAGTGITIQGQTISASGSGAPVEGASVSIQDFSGIDYYAYKHVVTIGQQELTTFSFECWEAEIVLTDALKEELEQYVLPNVSITNGAVTIKNDGTNMKLINSAPSENVNQHGTFTFYTGGGVSV